MKDKTIYLDDACIDEIRIENALLLKCTSFDVALILDDTYKFDAKCKKSTVLPADIAAKVYSRPKLCSKKLIITIHNPKWKIKLWY